MPGPGQAGYEKTLADFAEIKVSAGGEEVAFVSIAGCGKVEIPHEAVAFEKDAQFTATHLQSDLGCHHYTGKDFPQNAGKTEIMDALRGFFSDNKHLRELIISRSGHMTWGPEGGWWTPEGIITLDDVIFCWNEFKSQRQRLILIMAGCYSGGWVSRIKRMFGKNNDSRYANIVIQSSATGSQIGFGRATNGDRDAAAAAQATSSVSDAEALPLSSDDSDSEDAFNLSLHQDVAAIADARDSEGALLDNSNSPDEEIDPDELEPRDSILRYFLKLQTDPNLLWQTSMNKVVPRACHTVDFPGYMEDVRAAAKHGRRQFFFLHVLANGSQMRFTHVKEVPKVVEQPRAVACHHE